MIEVSKLYKRFQMGETELIALKGLTFSIPTGQFLSITGKSGSGKSTLLYQLSLLDHRNEGTITINDHVVTEFNEDERVAFRRDHLGYIFQDYALLPLLTAIENVMLLMLMHGMDQKFAAEKAMVALERVGLQDKLHNLPSQMSGGQQQRVSIARSIVDNPEILFADEPTANLDTESSDVVLDIFQKLNKEGQTIVMVTHEPEYAVLGDRIIELRDGSIISDKLLKKK